MREIARPRQAQVFGDLRQAAAPGGDFQGESVVGLQGQCRRQFDVEVPPARHRVDVRSEKDWRQRSTGAATAAEDVARGIDPWLEPRGLHQAHHVLAALHVGVGVRDAADAIRKRSAGRPAERAEGLEPLPERRAVHAKLPVR